MSRVVHYAILVTGSASDGAFKFVYEKAQAMFGVLTSPLVAGTANGRATFFIAPSGSKLGWPESKDHEFARAHFISDLRQLNYPDGSSPVDWVEVAYGDDERIPPSILAYSN